MDNDKIRELILLRVKTLEEPPRSARKDFAIEELKFIFNRIPDAAPPPAQAAGVTEEMIDRLLIGWYGEQYDPKRLSPPLLEYHREVARRALLAALAQDREE